MEVVYPNRNYLKLKDVPVGSLFWYQVDGCAQIKTDQIEGDYVLCVDVYNGEITKEFLKHEVCLIKSKLILEN